jgi:hypothetical protein
MGLGVMGDVTSAQERRIVLEMGALYVAYGAILGAVKMSDTWGTIPQWLTAVIACGAAIIAVISIRTQRDLARKRAAVDIFFKTEMDAGAVKILRDYEKALKELAKDPDVKKFYDSEDNIHLDNMLSCLNIHELIAVGIHKEVFDEDVCFDFWSDELVLAYEVCSELIKYMREQDRSIFSYADLEKLALKWKQRDAKATREAQKGALVKSMARWLLQSASNGA